MARLFGVLSFLNFLVFNRTMQVYKVQLWAYRVQHWRGKQNCKGTVGLTKYTYQPTEGNTKVNGDILDTNMYLVTLFCFLSFLNFLVFNRTVQVYKVQLWVYRVQHWRGKQNCKGAVGLTKYTCQPIEGNTKVNGDIFRHK